jgi:hypothetical protein
MIESYVEILLDLAMCWRVLIGGLWIVQAFFDLPEGHD